MKTLNNMLTDNPNILSFVTVPVDISDIDSESLKLAIIRRCGDVYPYYQDVGQFQLFGTLWFQTHRFLFTHALAVWECEYNPIENYDRHETESITGTESINGRTTDTHSGTDTTTNSGNVNSTDTHSGTDTTTTTTSATETETHGGTDSTVKESEIAGFNSANYSDANKDTTDVTHGETINRTTSGNTSSGLAHGETITTAGTTSDSSALTHGHKLARTNVSDNEQNSEKTSHIHGNIGVTTAQQMIEAELELMQKFWIYDYIASAFESENFITAYNNYFD